MTRLAGGAGRIAATAEGERSRRHRGGPASRRRLARSRCEAAQAAQRQEGLGDPARRISGAVLGPRPRARRAAPSRDRPRRSRRHDRRRGGRLAGGCHRCRRTAAGDGWRSRPLRRCRCRRGRGRRQALPGHPSAAPGPHSGPAPRSRAGSRGDRTGRRAPWSPRCGSASSATGGSPSSRSRSKAAAARRCFETEDVDFEAPAISHDGTRIAYARDTEEAARGPGRCRVVDRGDRRLGPAASRAPTGTAGRHPRRSITTTGR